jgi:hypothetical protein
MVNAGLETNWIELTADPDSTLNKPLNISQRSIGKIFDAKFGYPRIVVEAGFEEAIQVATYMMCFKSGRLEV